MFVYIIAFIQQKYFAPGTEQALIDSGSGQIIAIAFAVLNTVGFILPAFVLEPIVERIGRVRTHMLCVGVMSLAYFGIAGFASSPMALYALMAVAGIGWAAVVSLPFAIMTEKIDQGRTGFFMGIFNLSVVLPQLLVSMVVGTIILHADDKNVIFMISGVSLGLSALLWTTVHERREGSGTTTSTTSPSGH
jgi:MFS family permease